MKFNLLLTLLISVSLFSCKKNDPQIVSFSVDQAYTNVNFYFQTSGKVSSVEFEYGQNEEMLNKKSFTIDYTSGEVIREIYELGLVVGNTYYFRIRAVSDKGNFSDWSEAKYLLIGTLCGEKPSNVSTNINSVKWSMPDPQVNDVSSYQIEYGVQGFIHGTGTLAQTDTTIYSAMELEEGKTYDFYVRSLCDNDYGYSKWSGPHGLYANQNKNICLAPDDANYTINYDGFGNPSSVQVTFSDPGNCKNYEVNIVNDGQSADSNPSEFVQNNTISYFGFSYPANYDFYVRVVCLDSTNTAWYGPLNIIYQ